MSNYSIGCVLKEAHQSPVKAVSLIAEGLAIAKQLSAKLQPSSARIELWRKIIFEASKEISSLSSIVAAARARGLDRAFVADSRVLTHVKGLGRLVFVAMRCAWALEHFAGERGGAEGLLREWKTMSALGGWPTEPVPKTPSSVSFSEPRCWVSWNFIGPLDAVACLYSSDAPCHVACANLMANRFQDVKEM